MLDNFDVVMGDLFEEVRIKKDGHFPSEMAQIYVRTQLVLCKAIALEVFGKCDDDLLLELYDRVFQYDCWKYSKTASNNETKP